MRQPRNLPPVETAPETIAARARAHVATVASVAVLLAVVALLYLSVTGRISAQQTRMLERTLGTCGVAMVCYLCGWLRR
jgi:cytochrome bd-type quinol oxidase subunit 1